MNRKPLLLFLALLNFAGVAATAAPLGTALTYQGRVQSGGGDFNGIGQFKFALVTVTNTAATATATAVLSGQFVVNYIITSAGNGYLTAPTVTVSGGGGSGATAHAVIGAGVVTGVLPDSAGSGYTSAPTVTMSPPPENLSYTTYWSNDGTSAAGSEPVTAVGLLVSNGLFTTRLGDTTLANMTALPPELFLQPDLHLRVWFDDGVHGFAVLSPVQPLTPAPYAFMAGSANHLLGTVGPANLGGTYSNAVTLNNVANSFTGSGAGLTGLSASALASGTVPDARLSANVARTSDVWSLSGNSGTTPGKDFLGTTDDQPLEFKVNGLRAFRLENNLDGSDPDTTPDGAPNVIGGSPLNFVAAGVVGSTIAGGGATNWYGFRYTNAIRSDFGTVGGGLDNAISTNAWFATIGGGSGNEAASYSATVGGGNGNRALGTGSTIGGGGTHEPSGGYAGNTAFGNLVTIGGGYANQAAGFSGVIGGGGENTIGTNSPSCTIGGGEGNEIAAFALNATIPGGKWNFATNYAFAAGYRAHANHQGAFVWGDSNNADIASTNANSVTMRAAGGYRLFANSGATVGAYMAPGGNGFSPMSDRNVKENFQRVDPRAVLEKVSRLPVTEWNLISQPASIRHIGPMAQDFQAAFGVGEDDRHISTTDADGVALAAIQGLDQKLTDELKQKQAEITELKQRLERLEQLVNHKLNGGLQ